MLEGAKNMRSLPPNHPRFQALPPVCIGPWCPEVEAAVSALCNRERLHLAALIANAAHKARKRGDAAGAGRLMRRAARQLRKWQGD